MRAQHVDDPVRREGGNPNPVDLADWVLIADEYNTNLRTMRNGIKLARSELIFTDQLSRRAFQEGKTSKAGPRAAPMK